MRRHMLLILTGLLSAAILTGCTASADQRTGEAQGYGGVLRVTVTMEGQDITSVRVTEHHETEGVGTRAIDALPDAIVQADSTDVDNISGATMTSEAIREAVRQAMGDDGLQNSVTVGEGTNQASGMPDSDMRSGVGLAVTGRMGPGKAEDGSQVYSMNLVFAAGVFDGEGRIQHIDVDQLEICSPNLGDGNLFSGFPNEDGTQEDFLSEVKTWVTKGALREEYTLTSGSWREQMDAYQQHFTGKTVDEIESWFGKYFDAETGRPLKEGDAFNALSEEDRKAATDITSSATMSLKGEYGDVLLAIRRAWEDAQQDGSAASAPQDGTMTDTAQPTDAMTDNATMS